MRIEAVAEFDKELKRLAKKHPSVKNDFISLLKMLEENPFSGQPLGRDCYKIRMPIKSKGRGKSGGARVITYIKITNETLYLISIYDKAERSTISDSEIIDRLSNVK
jgi:mRNA-degrading endonuclease RelE of RelBE toxin-antitoxin system